MPREGNSNPKYQAVSLINPGARRRNLEGLPQDTAMAAANAAVGANPSNSGAGTLSPSP
jgi:hypothetical protein